MIIKIKINNINLLNYKISVFTSDNKLLLEKCNTNCIIFKAPYVGLYKIKVSNYKPINIYITETNCHTMNISIIQKNIKKFILLDENYPNLVIKKGKLMLSKNVI